MVHSLERRENPRTGDYAEEKDNRTLAVGSKYTVERAKVVQVLGFLSQFDSTFAGRVLRDRLVCVYRRLQHPRHGHGQFL